MKKIIVVVLGVYFSIGVLYSISFGFYFHTVAQRAGINNHTDILRKIKSAAIINDDIKLCIEGIMANGWKGEYNLTIPLSGIAKSEESDQYSGINFSQFSKNSVELSRQYIHPGCESKNISSIPIKKVELKINYSIGIDESVEEIAESNNYNLVIYEVSPYSSAKNNEDSKRILLVSNKLIFNNSRYVFVKVSDEKIKGSIKWYIVLPIAIIVDAATFPYQAYKWTIYAGSH